MMKDENKSILNASHTLDLLNNLSEENEQLKAELEFWKKQEKQCPMRSCK